MDRKVFGLSNLLLVYLGLAVLTHGLQAAAVVWVINIRCQALAGAGP